MYIYIYRYICISSYIIIKSHYLPFKKLMPFSFPLAPVGAFQFSSCPSLCWSIYLSISVSFSVSMVQHRTIIILVSLKAYYNL